MQQHLYSIPQCYLTGVGNNRIVSVCWTGSVWSGGVDDSPLTMPQQEPLSWMEVSQETVSLAVATMVTKDELRSSVEMLRAEHQATVEMLRSEIRASEFRTIRWTVGSVFAATSLVVAATSSIMVIAIRLPA